MSPARRARRRTRNCDGRRLRLLRQQPLQGRALLIHEPEQLLVAGALLRRHLALSGPVLEQMQPVFDDRPVDVERESRVFIPLVPLGGKSGDAPLLQEEIVQGVVDPLAHISVAEPVVDLLRPTYLSQSASSGILAASQSEN